MEAGGSHQALHDRSVSRTAAVCGTLPVALYRCYTSAPLCQQTFCGSGVECTRFDYVPVLPGSVLESCSFHRALREALTWHSASICGPERLRGSATSLLH